MVNRRIRTQREDAHFRVLTLVREQPGLSQRQMARELGISLGWLNFCLRELVSGGLVKVERFRSSPDRPRHLLALTPTGATERTRLGARFLQRKHIEYETLKTEIETLGAELADAVDASPPPGSHSGVREASLAVASPNSETLPGNEPSMTSEQEWLDRVRIAVIGLGYVGLPLAVEFGKQFPVTGFDIKADRIRALREGRDDSREISAEELDTATRLRFTTDPGDLSDCNVYLVTVPTPIDACKRPDLRPLLGASETVGKVLKKGDTVVYESTVYPGCTEEDCIPVLERASGLRYNRDFTAGYSPERINPGDGQHRLPGILKVTSGSTPAAAARIDALYSRIIGAGTYCAQSIKVAEAAKVIENTQRDLNIALINELAIIFNRMDIDTDAVLRAAETKWNFMPFRPGLVGGHCIGVDPYYLTHKAESLGYHPQVILAGRRINDGMGAYVAGQMVKAMLRKRLAVSKSRVLILGLAFKENCPDLRNTRVIDVIAELQSFDVSVDVHDPWADPRQAMEEYGLPLVEDPGEATYDGILLAVGHQQFRETAIGNIRQWGKENHVLYDIKHLYPASTVDARL